MRHSFVYGALCALGVMITANPVLADACNISATEVSSISVSVFGSGGGLSSVSCSVSGTTITVNENWTSTNEGVLLITGLGQDTLYRLNKVITNNSQTDFTGLSNELFNRDGENIGGGSTDSDGLSFVQDRDFTRNPTGFVSGFEPISGAGVFDTILTTPLTTNPLAYQLGIDLLYAADGTGSTGIFDRLLVDQLADRDFLNFFGGNELSSGGNITTITLGLRDRLGDFGDGFLLAQTPTFDRTPIPEPGTLLIFGFGLAGIGALRRRKFL